MTTRHTIDSLRARCTEVGDCWIWTGNKGVPKIHIHGRSVPARRALREMVDHMAIRPGLRVTAACGNERCISPLCSSAASVRDVCRAAAKRGAYTLPAARAKAAMTLRAKSHISDELVQRVRAATGTQQQIATDAGISRTHAGAIRRNKARVYYSNPFAGLHAITARAST